MRTCSLLFLSIVFFCCDKTTNTLPPEEGNVLAEVYGETLMDFEVISLIPETADSTDSLNTSNAYIEQWIRESLILHEAKKDAPPNIEQLVDDYRSSLLKVHFENKIIESNLDSAISDDELNTFYANHKSEYLLKEKAMLLLIIKINSNDKLDDKILELWDEDQLEELVPLVKSSNAVVNFEEKIWKKLSDLPKMFSRKTVKRIENNEGNRFSTTENGFKYFIKVFDVKGKNDIPPFSVIDNQLRKVILHKRKNKILSQYTEDLYQKEVRKKSIKTYTES